MPSYRMEFSDVNGESSTDGKPPRRRGSSGGGCWVSSLVGFVLVLLVMVLVVGVAVVVYFASTKDLTCTLDDGSSSSNGGIQDAVTSCKEWVENGGKASEDICGVCPAPETAPPAISGSTSPPTTPTTTAQPPYDRDEYRLPTSVSPSHYHLRMQPRIYGTDPTSFTFEGSVTIDVICRDVTPNITLHRHEDLAIRDDDVSVREKTSGTRIPVTGVSYEPAPQLYTITLEENLRRNAEYEVIFARFSGPLKRDRRGLFLSSYYVDGDREVFLAATQFESTRARKAFPCFDEPGLRANFSVTLLRMTDTDRSYRTLSNTAIIRENPSTENPGWTEDVYAPTVKMPTYLLAMGVNDFVSVSNTTMGVTFNTWARPNAIQYAGEAQKLGVDIFEHLESTFRPPYSSVYDKLDNIAVPGFGYGGMENWGLITYGEPILHRPGISTLNDLRFTAFVTAHEIAHMWFGNLVTPEWFSYLWMKEAMASFWHMQTIDEVYPEWRMTEELIVTDLYSAMTSDALTSSHPMTGDVKTQAEISSMYSSVTYQKGAFIMRMMHFIMGHDKFVEALNNYLEEHKFQSVVPDDLWESLNEVSLPGVDMKEKMDPWVRQMGYPLVTVTRPGNGRLRLEQQRFLTGAEDMTDERYKNAPYDYQWEIPITVTSSQDPNFTKTAHDIVWLEKNRPLETILDPTQGAGDDNTAWFVLNVQQYGYYRVQYDARNWNNLIKQLNTDHQVIHRINRAQIINDAWNLVKAEMLDVRTALNAVNFLAREHDYLPWRSFAPELNYVEMMTDRTEMYTALQSFVLSLTSGPLRELGLTINDDEQDQMSVLARVLLADIACAQGALTCVDPAQQQVGSWRTTGTNGIDANLRKGFYCTAVQEGGQAELDFILERFHTETDTLERTRLRQALACSKEPAQLLKLLHMAMEANASQSLDLSQVMMDVSANRWGRDIAFLFLVEQFSSLVEKHGSSMNSLISSATAHFKSEYDLQRLDLLEKQSPVPGGDRPNLAPTFQQARTKIRANMAWVERNMATLGEWLKEREEEEEEDEERLDYRLPTNVHPTHYELELTPHIYGNDSAQFSFEGHVTIHVQCDDATSDVILHADRLTLSDDDISVKQENSAKELFQSSSYEERRHFLRLRLTDPLEPSKKYIIRFIHFSGPLSTDGNGLYLSYYRDQGEHVYLATTQMEAVYARKAFPCFDEPQLKATFDVTLVRRNDTVRNYIALANAPLASSTSVTKDGHQWSKDKFQRSPVMPTYLLAFIVCDYQHVENTTAVDPNVTYSTYARPNAIQWADRAQRYGLKIFDWLSTTFQPPYSRAITKLDNIAIPDFSFGAMENWGLITYRENILYQPGVTTASNEFWMASVITHEIAHMWFGNYVSPKWWNWLWLNEAFASWWDVYATQQVFPTWKVEDDWVSNSVYSVMETDALATSHPMTADVQSPSEIGAIVDGVTYSKGAAIVRMMQFIMGFDAFVDGLNRYLARSLYGNAETSTLFSALDQKMHEEGFVEDYVTTKMHPWVSQMGFPVVRVSRTASGYHLTQQRFLIGSEDGADDRYQDPPYDYQWEIPITYATSDRTSMDKTRDDILWINKNGELLIPDANVNDRGSWILLNIHQVAYCRVLYDTDTWHALIGQLNTDPSVFSAINRGQLINDAWNLAKAGMLDMSIALSTLDFLQAESELVPWKAFAREIDYVALMLERTDLFSMFRTFLQDTLETPLQKLTLNIDEDMVPTDVFVRTLIAGYACDYGLVGCVNVAKRLFADWKYTGINDINPNLRYRYYCTSVAEGDETDWEFVYTQFKSSDDTSELTSLRHALSCTRDQTLLRRLLSMALDPSEIRTQDLSSTVLDVASNPLGRDLSFQFFVDNFDHLQNSLEPLYFGRVLTYVTAHFNTEYNLQQLQQLSEMLDVSAVRPVLDQAMAQTRANIDWLRDNYDVIQQWLTQRDVTPTPPALGSYRLPTNLSPYHYDLRLQPHIYGTDASEFFFEGSVTIHFSCVEDTSVITLHQDRLTLNQTDMAVHDVTDGVATSLPVADVTEEAQFHFYHIRLARTMSAGRNYSVNFSHFRGEMRKSGEGLYLSSYKDGDRTVYLATTQMEPTYFRQVTPSFDEPALKATFTVTLVRRTDTDRHYISLSNMPNITSQVIDESWTADIFEESMRMPTYLLAFVVCDYVYLSNMSTKYPVETRTYARPNRIQDARVAQDYSVELLDWFNERFEPKYETYLSKVDHIAIPDFSAGAMENWGLITYRERLLYNSMSTASDRSCTAGVPSHELAHMWFGNKVSPTWWTWLWLNEAFADYWETYVVEQLYPEWKSGSVVDMSSGVFYAMEIDSYSSSHPLSNPVETPDEINAQFDTITYTKGGAIIGMMHMMMGEHFIPGLNVYLQDNLLGNAEDRDLFEGLNKYISTQTDISLNMTHIMEPWVSQMGYPVVTVHRQGDTLTLTQDRFLIGEAPEQDTGKYGYKFEVPITYTTSSERNFNVSRSNIHWLPVDGSELHITLPSSDEEWAILNLRHEGYYRVNYDAATWRALIGQLNADHKVFDQVNRAALMDDAFNLAKAELLPLDVALQTLDYMKKETDYGPWRVFADESYQMELLIERTDLFAHYQRFMQETVDGPLKTLGFDLPEDNIPPIRAFTLSWIVTTACYYDHVGCVTKATALVSDWMNGLGNEINVNLRSRFYCTAVREGTHDVWNFFYQKYQEEEDSTEKSRLMTALGCSKDPAVLYSFLEMCLSTEEDPPFSSMSSCLSAVSDNRYGKDVAVNYVWENFPRIKVTIANSNSLSSMVDSVTQHFHTSYHLSQLQYFKDTYDVSTISNTLDRVQQRTVSNMRWVDTNLHVVEKWLNDKYAGGGPSDAINYRLPTSVIPEHYDLELRPEIYDPDPSTFTFSGKVTMFIRVVEPTSTVTFHSRGLDQQTVRDSASLWFENGTDTGYVQEVTFDETRDFAVLALSRELGVGETYRIYVEFSAPLPDNGVGLYYTSYLDGGTRVYLATTKFEAPYARRAFPCFDEPALKVTVNTTLVRKDQHMGRTFMAWSNNAKYGDTEDRGDGYFADKFLQTPLTSTYLLAFIVADFQCLTNTTKHGLEYSTCARPNGFQYGRLAQEWGLKEMEWLEDHFDPPYIMPKLDNMAIPDFLSGAMENWGLITYRESILYQEGVTSASDKDWTAEVVAHELAHMWFGNIVSPQWWGWLWLNEAFASFWDFHLVDLLQPDWRMTDQFVVQSMHAVMSSDALVTSHPMTAEVESPSEIQAIFDSVTYSKGAAVVRMMCFILGQDTFIPALNVYLHDRQYDVANHTHLFQSMDKYLQGEGHSLSMAELIEPWVTQKNFPVLHVHWSRAGELRFTQQRFLSANDQDDEDDAPFDYKWDIPITMTTSSSPAFDNINGSDVTWFRKSQPQLVVSDPTIPAPPTLPGDATRWVLINIHQYGYYRVSYPEANWVALIEQMKTDPAAIPVINRAQIINDAWSLARSGHLDMNIALQTLQVLRNEQDYVPWRAMSGELSYLDLMLSKTHIYGVFQDFMVLLVNGTFQDMGIASNPDDPPIQIFQRQRIVSYACQYGVHKCGEDATVEFDAWKSDPANNMLNVDMRRIILCNGVRSGDKADWEFVYNQYTSSAPGSQKDDLLSAISCSKESWLLQRLMDLTLDSSIINAQDVRSVLQSVSANPIGRDMAFTFLKQHYTELQNFMTPGSFGGMVVVLTGHFNTQYQLDELKQFMSQNDVSNAQTSFRQAVEQTAVNVEWMNDYYLQISEFLEDALNP